MCLQYLISIFAPFRSRSCVRSSRWPLILHCTFIPIIRFSTPRLREILISISQASFIPFSPNPFPTLSSPLLKETGQGWGICFSFLRRVSPINRLKAERKVITPYRWVVVRSASSIHSVTTQAFSPRISSGMFYFLRRVSPNKTKPLRESGKREECFNLDYHWRLSRE